MFEERQVSYSQENYVILGVGYLGKNYINRGQEANQKGNTDELSLQILTKSLSSNVMIEVEILASVKICWSVRSNRNILQRSRKS